MAPDSLELDGLLVLVGFFAGWFGRRLLWHARLAWFVRQHGLHRAETIDETPAPPVPAGDCQVDIYVFDGADGQRREQRVHHVCHDVPTGDSEYRGHNMMASSYPHIEHTLVATRTESHEV